MNNISRIKNGLVFPLKNPIKHFPDFTLTNIDDVTFVPM